MITVDFDHWPYPVWVAHRGAGKLAPENTLAAFRLGAHHGYRMFECDVKMSADGTPFLLHDDRLDRTTDGTGLAGALAWAQLSCLDAGSWHGAAYAGEPIARFAALAAWVRANRLMLDVEIKPTTGTEVETGHAVAKACLDHWHDADVPPFLTSFQPKSLEAARSSAPGLPRGLLVNELWQGWFETARQLECAAVVLKHTLVDAALVARARAARLRVGVYTPNDLPDVDRVRAAGVDMVVTDAVDVYSPRGEDDRHPAGRLRRMADGAAEHAPAEADCRLDGRRSGLVLEFRHRYPDARKLVGHAQLAREAAVGASLRCGELQHLLLARLRRLQAPRPLRIDIDVAGGAGQATAAVAGNAIDVVADCRAHETFEARHLHFLLAVVVENEYCLGHRMIPRMM